MRVFWIALVFIVLGCSSSLAVDEAKKDINANNIKSFLFNVPFSKLNKLVVGDPIKWVVTTQAPLVRAKLADKFQKFAYALCITGFLFGIWRARAAANGPGYAQAFVRFVVAVVLIGVSLNFNGVNKDWNISAIVFSAWLNAYGWSVEQFGDDVDAAMIEAEDALGDTLSQVTISAVSLTGATAGIQSVKAVAGSLAAKQGAGVAAKGAGKAASGALAGGFKSLVAKMKWVLSAFIPLLQAYGGLLYAAGFVMILGLLLMPVAFAMIAWGQGKLVYVNLMMLFTSILTVAMMPWIFSVGVKIAFVQPAQTLRFYNDEIALRREEAKKNTLEVTNQIRDAGKTIAEDCKAAIAADPTGKAEEEDPACRALRKGSWLDNLTGSLVDIFTQKLGIISDAINGLLNAFNSIFIGMISMFVGMIFAMALIMSLPTIIGSYLGINWSGKGSK
jgi:hypothetical protein